MQDNYNQITTKVGQITNFSQAELGDNPSVNLATGRLRYVLGGLSVGCGNFKIDVGHVYLNKVNSAFFGKFDDTFGNNWKLNLSQCVIESGNYYLYLDEMGEVHRFVNFDSNRYYDDQNAKVVLEVRPDGTTTNPEKYVITDGVGNKLCFNANGLLSKSVSCQNAKMVKIYEYDKNSGQLVSVYDARSFSSDHNAAKNRITFAYDAKGRLIAMTAYGHYFKKLSQLNYKYDEKGNLVSVSKTAFTRISTECLTTQIAQFTYKEDSTLLTEIADCESKSAMRFEYDPNDGKLTKMLQGVTVTNSLALASKDADGNTLALGMTECGAFAETSFKELKRNVYAYNFSSGSLIANETEVTNENGITITYFISRNASITSSFEKFYDKVDKIYKHKTLNKQCANRTDLVTGSTNYINGFGSATVTNGTLNITLPKDFDVARNESEKQVETFEYAFWLKHSSNYPRMYLEVTYTVNGKDKTAYVPLDGTANNAWQRVSVPIFIPKGKTEKLTSMTLKFSFVDGDISDTMYINEIGFSAMPHTTLRIPATGDEYVSYYDIQGIKINGAEPFNNFTNGAQYMTEEDIMATAVNKYHNLYNVYGKQYFDLICCNNTKRVKCVESLLFLSKDNKTASGKNGILYQSYVLMNSADSTIQTDYVYGSNAVTIRQKCQNTVDDEVVTSQTETVIDYKGNTVSETDEYRVCKHYDYDEYGNLKCVKVYKLNDEADEIEAVDSEVHYHYDTEGRLIVSHDGATGQKIEYNRFDQVSRVTEGKVTTDDTLELTSRHVDSKHDIFGDKTLGATEYDEDGIKGDNNKEEKLSSHSVTYENGRIRTVSDGLFKYGVKHDLANRTVQYTHFDENGETVIQTDTVTKDASKVETHTSKLVTNETISTKIDAYGKTLSTTRNDGDIVTYNYGDISESEFTNKPATRVHGSNTTEYVYDYDGELAGFTEYENGAKVIEVRQISPDVTKYAYPNVYGSEENLFVELERDPAKILNPRVTSVKYWPSLYNVNKKNVDSPVFQADYEYDAFGRVKYKRTLQHSRISKIYYDYDKLAGKTRLKKSNYDGTSYEGDGGNWCKSNYTANYTYGDKGEVEQIKDEFSWKRAATPDHSMKLFNTRKYTYNKRNQLVGEEQNIEAGNNTYGLKNTYAYLPDGRIESVNGIKHNYDEQGRLHSIADRAFGYDSYGNRTWERFSGGVKTYTYQHNLLTFANGAARYSYNTDGVRNKKVYNGVTTKYLLDGNKILGEIQSGLDYEHWTITNGKRRVQYLYDCDGINGAIMGEGAYEYVKDALGNVVMLIDQDDGKVACFYRYDAFGNCTVFDRDGKIDTDLHSIGNTNPIRWKSFYYDVETKFYYANGSYYDPSTGTYLDAAPVSAAIDNALTTNCLDRNAPVCNNILALAGNPFTVATASNLSPDPEYDPYANAPWYIKAALWYRKQPWYLKLFIGVMLVIFSIPFIIISGGEGLAIEGMLFEVAIGVILGIGSWVIGTLLSGGKLTWKGLGNAALDAFLVTAATVFIASFVSAIKVAFRSNPVAAVEYNFKSEAELERHFNTHNKDFGYMYTNSQEYLKDANYVIKNGTYVSDMNGYIRFYGIMDKETTFAFVGLTNDGAYITTYGIRRISSLTKVPWLIP